MESLDAYALQFEDMPLHKNPIRVGRVNKMTKSATTQEAPKVKSKYAKTRGEHVKDMLITALVVGIIAFIGGMTFQSKQQGAIDTAVKAVSPSVSAQTPVKK